LSALQERNERGREWPKASLHLQSDRKYAVLVTSRLDRALPSVLHRR
jgi:hypothetical protein